MSKLVFIAVLLFASLCGAYEKDYKDAKPFPDQVKLVNELLTHRAKQWKLNMGTEKERRRAKYLAGKAARRAAHRHTKPSPPKKRPVMSYGLTVKMGQMCLVRMVIDTVMPNGVVLAHENVYVGGSGATLGEARSHAYSYDGDSVYIEGVPTREPWVRNGAKFKPYMYLVNRANGKLVYKYQGKAW